MISLKQMAENKVDGVNKSLPTFQVNPALLEIEPGFNARPLDPEHVASFKAAYEAGAFVPAIIVRVEDGRVIVVDGHHRSAALQELIAEGKEILRTTVQEFKGNDAARVALMIGTSQGKALTPLQAAVQYRKLIGWGWTPQEIALKTGRTETHVKQLLLLVETNSDVQQMVERGEVAAHVAVTAQRKHGAHAGEVLGKALDKAKAEGKKKVTARRIKTIDEGKLLTFVQTYIGRTLVPNWQDADYVSFARAVLEEKF
jgi:ParB family transcriptional regulator, chromosome partitioning protein